MAPDPNRPFDSRSHLQRAAVKPNAPSRQLAQQHENQDSPSPLQPLNTAGLAGRPHQQGQQSQQGQSSSLPSSSGARTHEANKVQLQQLQDQSQRRQASADASGIGAGTSEALGVQQEQQSVLQRTTDAPLSKAASNNTSVSGRQLAPAGPQDGVLAKLGLGRKPGQTLQASSHISQAHSAAAPSGQYCAGCYQSINQCCSMSLGTTDNHSIQKNLRYQHVKIGMHSKHSVIS